MKLKYRFTRWYVRKGYTVHVDKESGIIYYKCPLLVRFFAKYLLSMVQYPWERMKKVFCDAGKASTKANESLKKFNDAIEYAKDDDSCEEIEIHTDDVYIDDVMNYEVTKNEPDRLSRERHPQ